LSITALSLLLALYLLLPIGGFIVIASKHGLPFGEPGLVPAFVTSVLTATATTGICALLGIPLGQYLATSRGRFAGILSVVVLLPLAIPPLAAGVLLVSVFGPEATIGRFFGGHLSDTVIGIVLAQTFVAAPFTIIAARSAFGMVDPSLPDVAATAGLRPWGRFRYVLWPSVGGAVTAGLVLTWLRAFGEFGATVILAYHPYSLPVYTDVRFGGYGLNDAMAPVAFALIGATVVLIVTRPRRRRRHSRVPVAAVTAVERGHADTSTPSERGGRLAFDIDSSMGAFELRVAHVATSPYLAILGPSGAGKTSVLRCLAGLVGPGAGSVRIGGLDLSSVPAEHRRTGYVPQSPALVPGCDVWRQVTLGPSADPTLAQYWIRRLGISGLETRMPDELSGGQARRVALARALSRSPELLLLDEPFTGLDAPVRAQILRELRDLQRELELTTVLVTHDPDEAALLADDVLIIDGGHVLQAGSRNDVFARPATPAVARLLGMVNILPGVVEDPGWVRANGVRLRTSATETYAPGTDVEWCVRPEDLRVHEAGGAGRMAGYPAVVRDAFQLGATTELHLSVDVDLELVARMPATEAPGLTSSCLVEVPDDAVLVWAVGVERGEVEEAASSAVGTGVDPVT
jgi:molybdate transport system permease protein